MVTVLFIRLSSYHNLSLPDPQKIWKVLVDLSENIADCKTESIFRFLGCNDCCVSWFCNWQGHIHKTAIHLQSYPGLWYWCVLNYAYIGAGSLS